MQTLSAHEIEEDSDAVDRRLAVTRSALDDAQLAALTDGSAVARVAALKAQLADLNERREELTAASRGARTRDARERVGEGVARREAALELCTSAVTDIEIRTARLWQLLAAAAGEIGLVREAEGRIRSAAFPLAGEAREAIDIGTGQGKLLLDSEITTLLADVARGRIADERALTGKVTRRTREVLGIITHAIAPKQQDVETAVHPSARGRRV